jgi:hypothetical protein
MFSKALIQAISDWQRGGAPKQKARRGTTLKNAARDLPQEFRTSETICYRQIALDDPNLRNLGTNYHLPETISSWTESEIVAEEFKGGVPANGNGYVGVIFKFCPAENEVVVNLAKLFQSAEFVREVNNLRSQIDGFDLGIGRYWDTQHEVLIEKSTLPLDSLHAWGGFTRDRERLKDMLSFSLGVVVADEQFDHLMAEAGLQIGQYWMKTPSAVARLAEALKHHADRVNKLISTSR